MWIAFYLYFVFGKAGELFDWPSGSTPQDGATSHPSPAWTLRLRTDLVQADRIWVMAWGDLDLIGVRSKEALGAVCHVIGVSKLY